MKVVEGKFGKEEETEQESLYALIAMALAQGGFDEEATGKFLLVARGDGSDLNVTGSNMDSEDIVYTMEALKHHIISYGGLVNEGDLH
jgi:hypothetical protein